MRSRLCTIIACLAIASCTEQSADLAAERQGIAELRVDAASLSEANVTRVVVQRGEETQELVRNNATGNYDGAILLAPGPQTLVARAFFLAALVGVSNPVTVDVTPGGVNRVILRIRDLTSNTPEFGPVLDSLTFPTSVSAETIATFAMSAISPTHDPITYQWSSDCTDSTFTAPDAAQTGWSKPSQGSCQIDVVATSNDYSIKQRFVIVVFSGADGAAAVNGVFVTAPQVVFHLETSDSQMRTQICETGNFSVSNHSCSITVSAPDTLYFRMSFFSAGWGRNSTPGDVTLSDDCGGHFARNVGTDDLVDGLWMPPAAGGLCILTVRAINGDGISTSVPAAVLTRPGTIPDTRPPEMFASLGTCDFSSRQDTPQDCGEFAANSELGLAVGFSWRDSRSGIVTVTDDCGGGQFHQFHSPDIAVFGRTWTTSNAPGTTCHVTVTATNLEGVTATAAATYQLL